MAFEITPKNTECITYFVEFFILFIIFIIVTIIFLTHN